MPGICDRSCDAWSGYLKRSHLELCGIRNFTNVNERKGEKYEIEKMDGSMYCNGNGGKSGSLWKRKDK